MRSSVCSHCQYWTPGSQSSTCRPQGLSSLIQGHSTHWQFFLDGLFLSDKHYSIYLENKLKFFFYYVCICGMQVCALRKPEDTFRNQFSPSTNKDQNSDWQAWGKGPYLLNLFTNPLKSFYLFIFEIVLHYLALAGLELIKTHLPHLPSAGTKDVHQHSKTL